MLKEAGKKTATGGDKREAAKRTMQPRSAKNKGTGKSSAAGGKGGKANFCALAEGRMLPANSGSEEGEASQEAEDDAGDEDSNFESESDEEREREAKVPRNGGSRAGD